MAITNEEKSLFEKLASGVLDGFVGDDLTTTGGSSMEGNQEWSTSNVQARPWRKVL